jgi:hypothetical protein
VCCAAPVEQHVWQDMGIVIDWLVTQGAARKRIHFLAPSGTRGLFTQLFNCPLVEFYGFTQHKISMEI